MRSSTQLLIVVWPGGEESAGYQTIEKVTGIGEVFFRSKNPQALSEWYWKHLRVTLPPSSCDEQSRRKDLDAMRRQLENAGIDVTIDPELYPNGRFASLEDPEGNQIRLWEPV